MTQTTKDALINRLEGTNINPDTFLATDYLNVFNEVTMLLEMAADMPDMLDELADWSHVDYVEHFRHSNLPDAELAIEAYAACPPEIKTPFDEACKTVSDIITTTVAECLKAVANGNATMVAAMLGESEVEIRGQLHTINSLIHGHTDALDQSNIDALMG